MSDTERVVHARSRTGLTEVVRYDKQGRWFVETPGQQRVRLATVQDAARHAVAMENDGGEIFLGRYGGKQFEAKVAGARRKVGAR